jgi:hypothetical protein
MSFKKVLNRELEVAFSKKSQPIWFRIAKYAVLGMVIYFLWGTKWLWITLITLFVVAMVMHFWVRYKTNRWTKSYGLWDYDKNKPRDP